jgi:hypothetical protein
MLLGMILGTSSPENDRKISMGQSVFVEEEFFALIFFSLVLPVSAYVYMMLKWAISRISVLLFSITLIAISGVNVILLQRLAEMSKASASLLDDKLFASEVSVTLYLLPAVFAGIGVNMLSHLLMSHLNEAEKRFEREHK